MLKMNDIDLPKTIMAFFSNLTMFLSTKTESGGLLN